jgi:hypothetical protein
MNNGSSKLQYLSEVLELRSGMNTGALCARMHDRMHHHRHHLGSPNVARGAPKAKVVEDRDVIRIRTNANHSGQRLAVKLKLHARFGQGFVRCL